MAIPDGWETPEATYSLDRVSIGVVVATGLYLDLGTQLLPDAIVRQKSASLELVHETSGAQNCSILNTAAGTETR